MQGQTHNTFQVLDKHCVNTKAGMNIYTLFQIQLNKTLYAWLYFLNLSHCETVCMYTCVVSR